MLVSIKWIKDYTDINVSATEYGDAMTMSGSNVEKVEELCKEIDKVVVGHILVIEEHPYADKLVVCQVDCGEETVQIVTGADNMKEGDYVPVALHGASLPGGIKIKKGKLRNVESFGMMCSASELGIGEDSDGLYILPEPKPVGIDIREVLGMDDSIIEFEITNNRADCLSVLGIARETAATLGTTFRYPVTKFSEIAEKTEDNVSVEVLNDKLCPRYSAKVISNVKIGDSPAWMQDRLTKAGMRPINNVVDVTNFVMLEMGQPLHAFDLDKLAGHKIVVRNAVEGEKIVTLDTIERTLTSDMLVIADGEKAIAIAGVMGGLDSEIDENTKTLVFESAIFDQLNVRTTSKKLGLRSEASSRFEKGVDPELADKTMDRLCTLVEELGIGQIMSGKIDLYPVKREKKSININYRRINTFLGLDISKEEINDLLTSLEFEVKLIDGVNAEVIVPTFRPDMEIEADVAEEVARLFGYDKIPSVLMNTTFTAGGRSARQVLIDATKNSLAAQGLFEVYTYSFVSPQVYNKICLKAENPLRNAIKIINPLGEENSIMRTTLIPNMMDVLSRNYNRKVQGGSFFELSKVYLGDHFSEENLADERESLAIGMYGNVDIFDLKGIIENLLSRLNINRYRFVNSTHDSLHPGRTAELLVNNKRVGYIGEVHPEALDNYEIPVRAYMAELNFEELLDAADLDRKYKQLPKFPAVERDIAIVVAEEITAGQIEEIIRNKGGKLVEAVKLFDIYRGTQIEKGYKSMAWSIVYRAEEKTLAEEDVAKVHNKILNSLANQVGGALRQ